MLTRIEYSAVGVKVLSFGAGVDISMGYNLGRLVFYEGGEIADE